MKVVIVSNNLKKHVAENTERSWKSNTQKISIKWPKRTLDLFVTWKKKYFGTLNTWAIMNDVIEIYPLQSNNY